MCEDCNAAGDGAQDFVFWFMQARGFFLKIHFDSCMREDCNVIDQDEAPMVRISIHACARIATADFFLQDCQF